MMTPDDVLAMLDAGADLVQLYTGYIYNGPGFVRSICEALIADANRKARQTGQESPGGRRGSRNPPPPGNGAVRRPARRRSSIRRTRSRHSGSRRSGFAAMIRPTLPVEGSKTLKQT